MTVQAEQINSFFIKGSVPHTPHTVAGRPGSFRVETRKGSLLVYGASSADSTNPDARYVVATYAPDDKQHQQIGRSDPAQLIAITLGVPESSVKRLVPGLVGSDPKAY